MLLGLTTTHRQTWLFSSTSTYHSTDLLTARGVAHLVVHGTSGSTSYETIPPVRLETSGGVLLTVDMVVQRRDGPRWLRDNDNDEDDDYVSHKTGSTCTQDIPMRPKENRITAIVNTHKNLVTIGSEVLVIWSRTDTHAHAHTDMLVTILQSGAVDCYTIKI